MDPLVNLTPASQHFGKMKEWLGFDMGVYRHLLVDVA